MGTSLDSLATLMAFGKAKKKKYYSYNHRIQVFDEDLRSLERREKLMVVLRYPMILTLAKLETFMLLSMIIIVPKC